MRPTPTRMLAVVALVLTMLPGASAAQPTPEPHMLDLPVLVAYCEQDPGNRIHPGGGRWDPQQEMKEFGCTPADGVDITVYNRSTDFFGRCTTDDDGICRIEAPTDPERELMVAIHMTTVSPGYAPAEVVTPAVHYTEFTGIGIPLFIDPELDEDEVADLPDRRTLAVKVEQDGESVEALTQLSAGEVTIEGFPWLATNEEGWVSYDLGLFPTETVDLMIEDAGEPRFACSDIDEGGALDTEWIEGIEGDFVRITLPDSDGNINCDISLP